MYPAMTAGRTAFFEDSRFAVKKTGQLKHFPGALFILESNVLPFPVHHPAIPDFCRRPGSGQPSVHFRTDRYQMMFFLQFLQFGKQAACSVIPAAYSQQTGADKNIHSSFLLWIPAFSFIIAFSFCFVQYFPALFQLRLHTASGDKFSASRSHMIKQQFTVFPEAAPDLTDKIFFYKPVHTAFFRRFQLLPAMPLHAEI